MIAVAIILSVVLGAAGQYYGGNLGSFMVIGGIWSALYLWKNR